MTLQAPFPWFGGKSRVGPEVWSRFGAVDNYVEPFAGSLAVLLQAPRIHRTETVNDADGFIANFFRATAKDPEAVARHADWPVSECDLHARHAWLVEQRQSITARLEGDPEWFEAKIAGWWVWGICCWIGSGWCSGQGPWVRQDGKLVHLGNAGQGVRRKLVHLGAHAGVGVKRERPSMKNVGVRRKLVHLGNAGQGGMPAGASTGSASDGLLAWFTALSERLRHVRVCCGDWSRVCGPAPTVTLGLTAVFLDPPYSEGERDEHLYAKDSGTVAADVREWALEHGGDHRMRIALCGYEGEHEMPGWSVHQWKTQGGYANLGDGSNDNAARERIWFSPHCLSSRQGDLFAEAR